ncbi:MAG: hypothetical protein HQL67_00935 [Magnetococcales bacterium]|nr:hypothetical protein [Magnetococcales bacterium]
MKGGRFLSGRVRSFSCVPRGVFALMAVALLAQLVFHAAQPTPMAHARSLPQPAASGLYQMAAFAEPVTLAKVLMLWLQAFDYQSGVSLSFQDLDPDRLEQWLNLILELDPKSSYPLLAASRFYADIPKPETQRILSAFVYRQFLKDPNRQWPWLGHVAILAKHRLHDLPLALHYAQALSQHATGADVPAWVRQMPLTILEDMGELELARIFIGGLLSHGEVTSVHERHLLNERLQELERKTVLGLGK